MQYLFAGQCYGAVSADKRRIALSLDSTPHHTPHKQLYSYSVTTLVALVCFINLVIFGAVFTVLQVCSYLLLFGVLSIT